MNPVSYVEQKLFGLVNQYRSTNKVPLTVWNDGLYELSRQHTESMSQRKEVFHSPTGSRILENVWSGNSFYHYSDDQIAAEILDFWKAHALDNAWLLHAPIHEAVVTVIVNPDGQYASWTFWTSGAGNPELVDRLYREYKASGTTADWDTWLRSKGY